ncbi:MAG: SDR family NAD(P)-dependent oxidoreductase [Pseudomonadota bacterium]
MGKKIILITGAAKGIGRASAERLIGAGFTVYGGDIAFDEMADLEANGLHRLHMDVSDDESVTTAVSKVMSEQGQIDGLFANAGYACIGMFECVPIEEAKKQFEVNVWGVARSIQAVLPHMRDAAPEGRGRILITSSVAGKISAPGMGWYPASKHSVEAIADSLRMEMKACFPGIKVVVIEPGFVTTGLYGASVPTWMSARDSPAAKIYRQQLENSINNFKRTFEAGSPVETISEVVHEALTADEPEIRYAPNPDSWGAVYGKRLMHLSGQLDQILISRWLGRLDDDQPATID